VSLGSIVAMVVVPVTYALRNGSEAFSSRLGVFVFLTAVAAVVIWRHRSNIGRLLRGVERRIGARATAPVEK
jgi:glycerol-3-phosphate acyltransferase PlsY